MVTAEDTLAVVGDGPSVNVAKVLRRAEELGWYQNPYTSLVVRLTRDDALPFFARWDLVATKEGKTSWRFQGARASNGQQLTYSDIFEYLEDPRVIQPEPPDEEDEAASAYQAWLNREGGE